jgi:hypothetical protein
MPSPRGIPDPSPHATHYKRVRFCANYKKNVTKRKYNDKKPNYKDIDTAMSKRPSIKQIKQLTKVRLNHQFQGCRPTRETRWEC